MSSSMNSAGRWGLVHQFADNGCVYTGYAYTQYSYTRYLPWGGRMSVRNGLLALLAESPKYGFQLKKEFEDATGALWPLNVGQVYTTLNRLVRDGQVVTDSGHGAGPATGVGDEGQKRYRITEAGRRAATGSEPHGHGFAPSATRWSSRCDEPATQRSTRSGSSPTSAGPPPRPCSGSRGEIAGEPDDLGRRIALDAVVAPISAELHWLDQAEELLTASTESHHAAGARPRSHQPAGGTDESHHSQRSPPSPHRRRSNPRRAAHVPRRPRRTCRSTTSR
jgi:hypothetical protein